MKNKPVLNQLPVMSKSNKYVMAKKLRKACKTSAAIRRSNEFMAVRFS